jgi:hypothetical protein
MSARFVYLYFMADDPARVRSVAPSHGAGVHPRIAQELLRHASSKTTMEIYSHVSAAQQREAVEALQRALAESHFESHLGPDSGGQDLPRAAETGQFERKSGSGGRTRTYDQAVNSRPLYH